MNEGHPVFSCLERLAQMMEMTGADLRTVKEIIPRTTVFTTHTPVPAGHDEFPPELVTPYLQQFEGRLGVPVNEILSWGQHAGAADSDKLSMFILGLRMSQYLNGVSELHGQVARRMWRNVWPSRPERKFPLGISPTALTSPLLYPGITPCFFKIDWGSTGTVIHGKGKTSKKSTDQ
jgi:starch phosphorylase